MIKDLIVNLAVGTERDRARDYALTIAEALASGPPRLRIAPFPPYGR
jgi:hypothetical protein